MKINELISLLAAERARGGDREVILRVIDRRGDGKLYALDARCKLELLEYENDPVIYVSALTPRAMTATEVTDLLIAWARRS